jgi:uncharacterized SAM-binding protein YcdF (DUF218 family)
LNLRWIVWSLLSPSQLIIACVVLGTLLLLIGRLRMGGLLTIWGGLALLVFGVLPTSTYLAHPLEARFGAAPLPADLTGIVLLSGAERPDASEATGQPQVKASGGRYLTTLRLATHYPNARVVFTSGALREPEKGPLQTQTAVGIRILLDSGIAEPRLTYEQRSTDTCDNAANTYALIRPKPGEHWAVVTSAVHMPRAVACFRAAGWRDVLPQPADYWAISGRWNAGSFRATDNLALLDIALHEWVGLVYYRATGRTAELFPEP